MLIYIQGHLLYAGNEAQVAGLTHQ